MCRADIDDIDNLRAALEGGMMSEIDCDRSEKIKEMIRRRGGNSSNSNNTSQKSLKYLKATPSKNSSGDEKS